MTDSQLQNHIPRARETSIILHWYVFLTKKVLTSQDVCKTLLAKKMKNKHEMMRNLLLD